MITKNKYIEKADLLNLIKYYPLTELARNFECSIKKVENKLIKQIKIKEFQKFEVENIWTDETIILEKLPGRVFGAWMHSPERNYLQQIKNEEI
jgi:hypothetical protein